MFGNAVNLLGLGDALARSCRWWLMVNSYGIDPLSYLCCASRLRVLSADEWDRGRGDRRIPGKI